MSVNGSEHMDFINSVGAGLIDLIQFCTNANFVTKIN